MDVLTMDNKNERLVRAWEDIARSLGRIATIGQAFYDKLYPEKREYREAIVTRVPTREDKIKERQGANDSTLADWLANVADEDQEEGIGPRERAFLDEQRSAASAKKPREAGQGKVSAKKTRRKP